MNAQIELKVTGHWMSYWFLRVFATPVALINGVAHDLRWAEFETLRVEPGRVELGVSVRYGKRDLIGGLAPLEPAQLDFAPGQVRRFVSQNGFVNHSPFLIYEVGPEDPR